MRAAISAFLSGCFILIRGRSTVTTTVEPRVYRYTHSYHGTALNVVCQRVCHHVEYARWFMPDRTYRTYKVAVVGLEGHPEPGWPTAHYPEFAPWFLVRSTFPFFQAINAYIDAVIEGVKEQRSKA